jgi:hypothetical protein
MMRRRSPSTLYINHHGQYHDKHEAQQELARPPCRLNWQGMGGHPYRGPNQQHACGNEDPFAKVKFSIPPFYGLYNVETYLD